MAFIRLSRVRPGRASGPGRFQPAALILLAALAAASPAAAARPVSRTIEHGGLKRTYLLRIPASAPRPAPLVLALHGGGGKARSMDRFTGLGAIADREGFMVAYPDSGTRNWYDGREGDFSGAHKSRRDDAGFLAAVIDAVDREHPVDPARVYVTGISNGAFMSNYLAALRSERIAAIAPVVGGLADPFHKSFAPKEPVSVLVIQGTEDPLVPYEGGAVARGRGRLIPTEEALKLWAAADGCAPAPRTEALPDKDPADGCRVTRLTWSGCRNKTEVVLLRLEGGGHTWPSGPQYLPKRLIGRVCREFGSSLIWDFFKSHPKSRPAP